MCQTGNREEISSLSLTSEINSDSEWGVWCIDVMCGLMHPPLTSCVSVYVSTMHAYFIQFCKFCQYCLVHNNKEILKQHDSTGGMC